MIGNASIINNFQNILKQEYFDNQVLKNQVKTAYLEKEIQQQSDYITFLSYLSNINREIHQLTTHSWQTKFQDNQVLGSGQNIDISQLTDAQLDQYILRYTKSNLHKSQIYQQLNRERICLQSKIPNLSDQTTKLHNEIDNYQLIISKITKENYKLLEKHKTLNYEKSDSKSPICDEHDSYNWKKSCIESSSILKSSKRIPYKTVNSSNIINGMNLKQNEKYQKRYEQEMDKLKKQFERESINQRILSIHQQKLEVYCEELQNINTILLQSIQKHKKKIQALKNITNIYNFYQKHVNSFEQQIANRNFLARTQNVQFVQKSYMIKSFQQFSEDFQFIKKFNHTESHLSFKKIHGHLRKIRSNSFYMGLQQQTGFLTFKSIAKNALNQFKAEFLNRQQSIDLLLYLKQEMAPVLTMLSKQDVESKLFSVRERSLSNTIDYIFSQQSGTSVQDIEKDDLRLQQMSSVILQPQQQQGMQAQLHLSIQQSLHQSLQQQSGQIGNEVGSSKGVVQQTMNDEVLQDPAKEIIITNNYLNNGNNNNNMNINNVNNINNNVDNSQLTQHKDLQKQFINISNIMNKKDEQLKSEKSINDASFISNNQILADL